MSMTLRSAVAAAAIILSSNSLAQNGSDWTNASLAEVQSAAKGGLKTAQYELGRRYEEGIGLERDTSKARKWYKKAAGDTVDQNFVYSGPVGSEQHGRAIKVGRPHVQPGLPAAATRLKDMERADER
ncbi:hypothetical protein Sj15T_24130 [Sphingobium sp. TA15]|uniref:Sel1-like TPR repeat protein n=1 Tax=Sphingobium indicum (strain DSM 16413 / CCM 7287 / MTCC 6362 / UT26 / NBRC 101211 / UT26S) TaxID=452662 RepID=D4Z5X9_SPHIU|nr:SEL1-like repeat protein [Sphingobium indicum]BAI98011.1 Sel1-like TPR repeat protein [Sphingobium indicum UT26S]BDD67392.1 hypothetical protein Sj15T_24130 [Sphingobium sp. TA15]